MGRRAFRHRAGSLGRWSRWLFRCGLGPCGGRFCVVLRKTAMFVFAARCATTGLVASWGWTGLSSHYDECPAPAALERQGRERVNGGWTTTIPGAARSTQRNLLRAGSSLHWFRHLEFHALSALTATCATRKVPSSSTRWGDILPRQRVQPSGCLLRGDTTWPGSQADVSSNGSSFAASIFAYVVTDNGAAMTQSPPRLTLEWLMPQELGA